MTDKQRDYILGLDEELFESWQINFNQPRILSKDILGKDWPKRYKDISQQETSWCIERLLEEVEYCDCRHSYDDWSMQYM